MEVLPGANRPNWKRFLPRMLSLETIPQINSSVRACVRPWLESVKALVLIISPAWVSKLPGMLGPLWAHRAEHLIQPLGDLGRSCASERRAARWAVLKFSWSAQAGRGSRVVLGSSWIAASSGGVWEPVLRGRCFLTAQEGPVQEMISETHSLTGS